MTNYCTPDDVRRQISLTTQVQADTTYQTDSVMEDIIEAVSGLLDEHCGRKDGFVADTAASAREFVGTGQRWLDLTPYETTEVTLVETKSSPTGSYVSWSSNEWRCFRGSWRNPVYAISTRNPRPYTHIMTLPNSTKHFYSGYSGSFYSGTLMSTNHQTHYDAGLGVGYPTVRITAKWGFATTCPAAIRQACVIESARLWKRAQGNFTQTIAMVEFNVMEFAGEMDNQTKALIAPYIKPSRVGR